MNSTNDQVIVNGFTITKKETVVSIKPGLVMFEINNKELRNGESEFTELNRYQADFVFKRLQIIAATQNTPSI